MALNICRFVFDVCVSLRFFLFTFSPKRLPLLHTVFQSNLCTLASSIALMSVYSDAGEYLVVTMFQDGVME